MFCATLSLIFINFSLSHGRYRADFISASDFVFNRLFMERSSRVVSFPKSLLMCYLIASNVIRMFLRARATGTRRGGVPRSSAPVKLLLFPWAGARHSVPGWPMGCAGYPPRGVWNVRVRLMGRLGVGVRHKGSGRDVRSVSKSCTVLVGTLSDASLRPQVIVIVIGFAKC